MKEKSDLGITRREFAVAAAATAATFMIVPRHVLGGTGYIAPSDKVTIASIGLGRQGLAITMELMSRPEVQIISVCDCNRESKNYLEYEPNALLNAERKLLGPGFANWGQDLASPGERQVTRSFRSSLGTGGREPAQRLVEAYYGVRTSKGTYKGCTAYNDYRELLEKEKDLDAVYIATPDHWHAPISMAAMRKRKHVLCQKPMTHTIGESQRVAQVAREMNVAAGITVNNPSTSETKLIAQWIAAGAIGNVREVHNWSNRPSWPQGIDRPSTTDAVPQGLDWDLWLGPAEPRPFSHEYLPFVWRGWYDFGCGSFGDMGCYSFAGIFKILGLTPPTAVEATASQTSGVTYPGASIVHLDFPQQGARGPVRLTWYDGGLQPARPAGLRVEDERFFKEGGEGVMYVGDRGYILGAFNGDTPRVYPESSQFVTPPPNQEEWDEMHDLAVLEWIAACKGGPAPLSSFELQAPVTETFLLGCLAQRFPWQRLEWNTATRQTNSETVNRYVDPPYRQKYLSD
ncbi:MAG TPA: Gfo/Idh/MocA family oxidoreductase [Acidobacteriaceae bacterium]|jgi:predicted dehydrogenase|nr:Gfo/Idh/MocA family oxidoreductase [Acidobacteriaceae bacterium]